MALIAKKVQGSVPERLRGFVAENLEALEPGLQVLETSLRLGRSTVDVVAVDGKQTLVLIAVAEVADAAMLVGTLDAYIWCVAFPDNMRRLYPDAIAATRPPRVVFVATKMPAAFLDLVECLSVISPECHELAGLPDEDLPASGASAADLTPAPSVAEPQPVSVEAEVLEPTVRLSAGFDAEDAHQWESFVVESSVDGSAREAEALAAASTTAWPPRVPPYRALGNGHAANGKAENGQVAIARATDILLADAVRAAESAHVEHAAVNLGVRPRAENAPAPLTPAPPTALAASVVQSAAAQATAESTPTVSRVVDELKPVASRPAHEETRTVNHPALQALRFPKTGVSRQWQEFLDQLAANQ
jgi:hypothetical protein